MKPKYLVVHLKPKSNYIDNSVDVYSVASEAFRSMDAATKEAHRCAKRNPGDEYFVVKTVGVVVGSAVSEFSPVDDDEPKEASK